MLFLLPVPSLLPVPPVPTLGKLHVPNAGVGISLWHSRVPARLPFPQVTARALAYMFIFSVTTMSLLSLKRNPGNFWLISGNKPQLGWQ